MLNRKQPIRRTRLRVVEPGARVRPRRPRSTGPTSHERLVVAERANWCCELCGTPLAAPLEDGMQWTTDHSFHHRLPRGMGGTSDPGANNPSRLLLLCGTGTTGCHGMVESQRMLAYSNGWLVHRSMRPADVAVLVYPGELVMLTLDGRYETVT